MVQPILLLVAGPNGSGKSTFIQSLMKAYNFRHVVNPDALQKALGVTGPATARAGREALLQVDSLLQQGRSLIWESTLASHSQTYTGRIRRALDGGYLVHLHLLWLSSVEACLRRIAGRVQSGGHDIAQVDVERRYPRIATHFHSTYRALVHEWYVWDNDNDDFPRLVAKGTQDGATVVEEPAFWRQFLEVAGEP